MLWICKYIPLKKHCIIIIGTTRPLPSNKSSVVYVIISESTETWLVSISIRAISMHKIESREISNRKYLSKTTRVFPILSAGIKYGFLWEISEISQIRSVGESKQNFVRDTVYVKCSRKSVARSIKEVTHVECPKQPPKSPFVIFENI